MNTNPTPQPDPATPEPGPTGPAATSRRRRIGAVAGAGLLAGLIAVAVGGVAAAQNDGVVISQADTPDSVVVVQESGDLDEMHDGDLDETHDEMFFEDVSDDDKAIWDQFDQCLTDSGVDFDALETMDDAELENLDEAAIDAAFEACESVLDGLSDEAYFMEADISPEDEAVFDQFDQCLTDSGVDFDALEKMDDAELEALDESAIDAAFEACEPILDNLSEDLKAELDEWEEFCDEDHEDGELEAEPAGA
ncbi:MAG: hypothetical protein AAF567_23470 [Actinomycetota bacterium]